MASLRFTDVQVHPMEFLDLTSLTLDELHQLIHEGSVPGTYGGVAPGWETPDHPPVCRVQKLPLSTPEERLFFLLTYLKTYALQVVQGRLFGMGQSKANQAIPAA